MSEPTGISRRALPSCLFRSDHLFLFMHHACSLQLLYFQCKMYYTNEDEYEDVVITQIIPVVKVRELK